MSKLWGAVHHGGRRHSSQLLFDDSRRLHAPAHAHRLGPLHPAIQNPDRTEGLPQKRRGALRRQVNKTNLQQTHPQSGAEIPRRFLRVSALFIQRNGSCIKSVPRTNMAERDIDA